MAGSTEEKNGNWFFDQKKTAWHRVWGGGEDSGPTLSERNVPSQSQERGSVGLAFRTAGELWISWTKRWRQQKGCEGEHIKKQEEGGSWTCSA